MAIKMTSVNFPNRGKGAKGFRSVMVPGIWSPMKFRKNDDGKDTDQIERPELLPETVASFRTATMIEVEKLFKENNVQWTVQECALYGLIEKQTSSQDNSVAYQINVMAIAAGYNEETRKGIIAAALGLIKVGGFTAETAFETLKTLRPPTTA